MVRDYSAFLPRSAKAGRARCDPTTLQTLGWGPFFAQQIDIEALNQTPPVRVVAVHRGGLHVVGDGIDETISPSAGQRTGHSERWSAA